jgi:antitoxin component YwqK of YwqJK toxin-antitoxin module
MNQRWYVLRDGEEWEVTRDQLKRLAANGEFQPGDKIRKDGMHDWVSPDRLRDLLPPRQNRPEGSKKPSRKPGKRFPVSRVAGGVAVAFALLVVLAPILARRAKPAAAVPGGPSDALAVVRSAAPINYDENPVPASELDFSRVDYTVRLSAPDYSKGPHSEPLLVQHILADPIQFYQPAEYRSPVLEEGFLTIRADPRFFAAGLFGLGTLPKGTSSLMVSGALIQGRFVLHGRRIVYSSMSKAHAADKKELEEWWFDGKRHGSMTRWYLGGKKQAEGVYVEDKPAGIWTEWSEEGIKSSETPYFDGQSHGILKGWHANGKLRLEGTARKGKWHGKKTQWHENGEKQEEGFWVDGRRQGWLKEWTKDGHQDVTQWDKGDVAYVPAKSSRRAFIWKLNVAAARKGFNNELVFQDMAKFLDIFGTPQMQHTTIPRARDGTLDYGAALDLNKPGIQEWIYTCTDAQMSLRVENGRVFVVHSIGEIAGR